MFTAIVCHTHLTYHGTVRIGLCQSWRRHRYQDAAKQWDAEHGKDRRPTPQDTVAAGAANTAPYPVAAGEKESGEHAGDDHSDGEGTKYYQSDTENDGAGAGVHEDPQPEHDDSQVDSQYLAQPVE